MDSGGEIKKLMARDLKAVYSAPTEEAGLAELEKVEEKWIKKYPFPLKS